MPCAGRSSDNMIRELSDAAAELPLNDKDELSVDWLNGRRTPDANQELKAAITGLNLGTDAPRILKRWLSQPVLAQRPL